MPVYYITEFDAIASVARRETDGLHELRIFRFANNFHSHANGTILDNTDLRWSTYESSRWPLLVLKIHVPGRPLPGVVGQHRQPDRSRQKLSIDLLVEDL